MKNKIEDTIKERDNNYGSYSNMCIIVQNIKDVMRDTPNWPGLTDDKKESLETMATKIGRILNGDPEHYDSWHDIVGYAKLIENTLEK